MEIIKNAPRLGEATDLRLRDVLALRPFVFSVHISQCVYLLLCLRVRRPILDDISPIIMETHMRIFLCITPFCKTLERLFSCRDKPVYHRRHVYIWIDGNAVQVWVKRMLIQTPINMMHLRLTGFDQSLQSFLRRKHINDIPLIIGHLFNPNHFRLCHDRNPFILGPIPYSFFTRIHCIPCIQHCQGVLPSILIFPEKLVGRDTA